ncbi:MAG: DUF1501 domain-containing protein, partial [Planctomycetales bacterium]|nr:DUF1501 domain-containing protein [Planctomycetales bacterium]
SEQLKSFDVSNEPQSLQDEFGDTPFGRSCLAATRLIEHGVRCIEITLGNWDSHANNHEFQAGKVKILDPAFAAMLRELKRRDRLDSTIVICGGEFGRTPTINPLEGRDHWPSGFSIALAGGGIAGGQAIGETSPDGEKLDYDDECNTRVQDIHATVLHALGIRPELEMATPIGRPMKLSDGRIQKRLLKNA